MIAIGSDHGGYELKQKIINHLKENNISFKDFGCFSTDSCDYPDIAKDVALNVASHEFEFGILICGTGIGISIAANKIKGIRAACCHNEYDAKFTRLHNNANILCLGGRVLGDELSFSMVDTFLNTKFEGGRHKLRIDKIKMLEN